jgi:hypothetical protein
MVKKKNEPEQPAQAAPPANPGKTDYAVPPEVFIATWQTSASAIEVAERLKMPKDIVHARASTYRQAGIKLKKMPRHRTKALDVAHLNQIIDEIEKQHGKPATEGRGETSSFPPPNGG